MAKKEAVKEAVRINSNITTEYAKLIESGEGTNTEALNFILEVGEEMAKGTTTREVKASMQEALKGVNVKPVVLPNHVDALNTACLIINRFADTIGEVKASKVLSLAVRVNYDKKASGAKAHVNSAKSFEELDEATLSKKESQTRDASASAKAEVKKQAPAITLETIVDNFGEWLKAQDLKTIKTTEAQKLDALIAKLIQVSKNSKVSEKANA